MRRIPKIFTAADGPKSVTPAEYPVCNYTGRLILLWSLVAGRWSLVAGR